MQKTASLTRFKSPLLCIAESSLPSFHHILLWVQSCQSTRDSSSAWMVLKMIQPEQGSIWNQAIMSPRAESWKFGIVELCWWSSSTVRDTVMAWKKGCTAQALQLGNKKVPIHAQTVEMFYFLSSKMCKLAGASLPRQKLFRICLKKYQP